MKIRTKFSVASGVVVFVVISLLSLSTYWLIEGTLKQKTQAYVEDSGSLLAKSISNWLVAKRAQIEIVKSQIESNFSAQNFQAGLEIGALKNDFLLMFGTLDNETQLRSNNPNRVNPPNVDFRQRAWYQLAKHEENTVFTAPYIDAATNELLLSAVAPIFSGGQFKGVVGGDLSLSTIAESVNTINFNQTGFAFIADGEGNVVTHPDQALNGKNTQAVYRVLPDSRKEIMEIEYKGDTQLLYFLPLSKDTGVKWYLAVMLEKSKVYQSLSQLFFRTIIFAVLSIALCIFILRKLAKHLLRPLDELDSAIAEVASGGGDLTQRLKIKNEDECGAVASNFNRFLTSLQGLVKALKNKANRVVTISDDAKQLSTASTHQLTEQVQLIDSLATAMNEMSATSAEIASSAQEAATSITSVNRRAGEGQQLFNKTRTGVQELAENINQAQQLSNELAQYSKNIEQVLSVINGVAEQTNLLALNAAIEAARAGEQGRGFAVVADEVRTLASRTQESTTEIKVMIEQIQQYSGQVQEAMNESTERAGVCVEHTEVANQSLADISRAVKDIMDRNIQIATAIEEQSVVIEDINKNTTNINDISDQVADYSAEQISSSERLVEEVDGQQVVLEEFKV